MWELVKKTTEGYNKRFPGGDNPFMIVTRLAEECGEIAEQVNHFENTGIKQKKLGKPDSKKLAKEIKDIMNVAMQLAKHYAVEKQVEEAFEYSYKRMVAEGLVD